MPNLARIKEKAAAADAQQGTGGLLTRKVDVAAKSMLTAKLNPNQPWEVYQLVDRSGSMYRLYPKVVQAALDCSVGFSLIVDDDGNLPTVFFDNKLEEHVVTTNNFHNFVERAGIQARNSTDLTAALKWLADKTGNGDLFGGGGGLFSRKAGAPQTKKRSTPVFAIIITDGRPDDPATARDAVQRLSYRGILLKFIYVGNDRTGWEFLESLDDDIPVGVDYAHGGRLFDNVDAKKFSDLASADDQTLYAAMFDEAPEGLTAMKQNALIG